MGLRMMTMMRGMKRRVRGEKARKAIWKFVIKRGKYYHNRWRHAGTNSKFQNEV